MSVNKQFQALSGGLEGVLQKGLQEMLEEVYTRVRAELQLQDEQIQAQNTQYRTKIAELEAKVQELGARIAQRSVGQEPMKNARLQQNKMAVPWVMQQNRATGPPKIPVLPKSLALLKRPAAPKAPFPPPSRGKEASTVDLTAILASRPENKKWQTVPARRKGKSRTA